MLNEDTGDSVSLQIHVGRTHAEKYPTPLATTFVIPNLSLVMHDIHGNPATAKI